jgi:hypothetical protein
MHFGHFIIALAFATVVLPLAAFYVIDARASRREAERQTIERAARAEARRNYKRQVYPALDYSVPSACRNAPDIPSRLELAEPLTSDTSALMTCEVLVDGDYAHGPFGSWLEERTGVTIRRLSDVEGIAKRYPHQEWLVKFVQPLQSMLYQRHADGQWNLVRIGGGMF